MNNKKLKDILFYILLFASWFLPGLDNSIHLDTGILFSAFIVSCAVHFFVRNAKYKVITLIAITVAATIYNFEYVLLYIPVLMLLIMFDFLDNKDSNNIYETCNTMYIVTSVFKVFYLVFLFITKAEVYVNGRITFYSKIAGIIVGFFLLLLFISSKKNLKIPPKKLSRIKVIYISSLIGLVIDVCILSLKNVYGEIQAAQFDFLTWFVFVLCIMYFEDPVSEFIFSEINNRLQLFLGIGKQSK